jgi:hypothetical protein
LIRSETAECDEKERNAVKWKTPVAGLPPKTGAPDPAEQGMPAESARLVPRESVQASVLRYRTAGGDAGMVYRIFRRRIMPASARQRRTASHGSQIPKKGERSFPCVFKLENLKNAHIHQ